MKKSIYYLLSMFIILGVLLFATVPALAEGQNGTTLTADVSASPYWTRTFPWTIDKSVAPDELDMFKGDSGDVLYTITLTKGAYVEVAWVSGEICVNNGGEVATEGLAIEAILQNGYEPPNDFLASAPVDVSGNPVLDPGETGCYSYRVNIPSIGGEFSQPHAGGTYKVTAEITITNHSGYLGTPFGPSPKTTTVFPDAPTLINDSVNVDDTNGGSWLFTGSGSVSYSKTFTCNNDAGEHNNTATIRETGQNDSASVQVNCYELTVSKTAVTSFTRTYTWNIDKSADESSLTLSLGQIFQYVHYDVVVGATFTDSNWAVQGTITISNPAPMDATLVSVTDLVSPDIAATVDCPTLIVPTEGSLQCTYSAALPNATARVNTATATLQNNPSGTTNFISPEVPVSFSGVDPALVDECVDVSDTYAGFLGTICYDDPIKSFSYAREIGPYTVCGEYDVANTASFVTNDTSTTGSDSQNVHINVPCLGCTLTQGYWKTHSINGPAPYDDGWAGQESTTFFLSGQTWYQVLNTSSAGGNAYYILAHQYIAATLNIQNGANGTAAAPALTAATNLFNTYTPAQVLTMKGKTGNTVRALFVYWANILDQYNTGLIGPGHCSE